MCGFVGIASKNFIHQRDWLFNASQALYHRGPDGSGLWWSGDGKVGIAHRRLSIIDLSASGHQPMADVEGSLHIVFNGEIYNHTELRHQLITLGHSFRSKCDTEVLLVAYRQWGEEFITHLTGMFAFALHDAQRGLIFIARDRVGEKPLYYWCHNGSVRFASELKALFCDPELDRRVDMNSLDCFLGLGFVPGTQSILQHVKKLPPAHTLKFNLASGVISINRYWSLPVSDRQEVQASELVSELEKLLQASVNRQLIADVPVGVLLSGGLDSSIVTALAARGGAKIKTFTVRFPDSPRHDEAEHAQRVANFFGTDHLTLDAEISSVNLLHVLAKQFDEPMNDSSMLPTFMVSCLVRQYCKVALGGDGGDELFAGYTHYNRILKLKSNFGRFPRYLRNAVSETCGAILPVGFKGRNWLQALNTDFEMHVPMIAIHFDRVARRNLLGLDNGFTESFWKQSSPTTNDMLQRITRIDFHNYLPEDILVKVDRASMLASLELRSPLLDHHVVEFAFRNIPSHMRATPSGRKIILRRLAQRLLPSSFDLKRKQGFSVPMAEWLNSGPWLNFFKEVLLDSQQTTFNRSFIELLFQGQAAGRLNSERLFGLVMFELWRKEYKIVI